MIERIRTWWRARIVARSSSTLKKRIDELRESVQQSQTYFNEERDRLASELDAALNQLSLLEDQLDNVMSAQKRYEGENEALRTKISIMERVAVPGLTQSNQVLLERLDAMTAHEVRKQMLFKASEGE